MHISRIKADLFGLVPDSLSKIGELITDEHVELAKIILSDDNVENMKVMFSVDNMDTYRNIFTKENMQNLRILFSIDNINDIKHLFSPLNIAKFKDMLTKENLDAVQYFWTLISDKQRISEISQLLSADTIRQLNSFVQNAIKLFAIEPENMKIISSLLIDRERIYELNRFLSADRIKKFIDIVDNNDRVNLYMITATSMVMANLVLTIFMLGMITYVRVRLQIVSRRIRDIKSTSCQPSVLEIDAEYSPKSSTFVIQQEVI